MQPFAGSKTHAISLTNTEQFHSFKTPFARSPFGNAIRTAAQGAASRAGVAALRASLGGFDTHSNQSNSHARLHNELAEGLGALRAALLEIGRWDGALAMAYAEFGRRPRENLSRGTDHGTAHAHFVVGGRVRDGLYGLAPGLSRLDGNTATCHSRWISAISVQRCSRAGAASIRPQPSKAASSPWGCGRPDAAGPRRRGRSCHDGVLGRRQAA
jgi:uncharacterized protein (DUF1501 family)